jgi:hypothetical protein
MNIIPAPIDWANILKQNIGLFANEDLQLQTLTGSGADFSRFGVVTIHAGNVPVGNQGLLRLVAAGGAALLLGDNNGIENVGTVTILGTIPAGNAIQLVTANGGGILLRSDSTAGSGGDITIDAQAGADIVLISPRVRIDNGPVIAAPDATLHRVVVDNAGALSTTPA